jgi:hypothetical protein
LLAAGYCIAVSAAAGRERRTTTADSRPPLRRLDLSFLAKKNQSCVDP